MSETVIKVESLAKKYQLGTIGYGSLRHDIQAWFARIRRKEDPNTRIGETSRLDLHGDFWALRDVSFSLERGDRLGIIGRNGAGKSTLLRILSHITKPTAGAVKLKGRVASLLEVGTGFHPELTGRENVFLNGAIMGMKRREIQQKFDEIVNFSGVEQFIDTPVKRYSSGMYVRLAFAVAAHLEPDILIVDEVLAVGDSEFQKKCLGKMEDISTSQGRTVLYVSHNMSSIRQLCQKGMLLSNGNAVLFDKVERVVSKYLESLFEKQEPVAERKRPSWLSRKARIVGLEIRAGAVLNPVDIDPESRLDIELQIRTFERVETGAWVIVQNENSQAVLFFDSGSLQNTMFRLEEGTAKIRLTVNRTNLVNGNYSLSVGLVIPNREWIDQVWEAYRFSVTRCDPFGSGFNLSQAFAAVHTDHSWEKVL